MFEDQVFFMKLGLGERVFVSSQCWARYRQRADSNSARAEAAGQVAAARLRLFDWLTGYLEQQRVQSPQIREQMRRYRQHSAGRACTRGSIGLRTLRWRVEQRWHEVRYALSGLRAIHAASRRRAFATTFNRVRRPQRRRRARWSRS